MSKRTSEGVIRGSRCILSEERQIIDLLQTHQIVWNELFLKRLFEDYPSKAKLFIIHLRRWMENLNLTPKAQLKFVLEWSNKQSERCYEAILEFLEKYQSSLPLYYAEPCLKYIGVRMSIKQHLKPGASFLFLEEWKDVDCVNLKLTINVFQVVEWHDEHEFSASLMEYESQYYFMSGVDKYTNQIRAEDETTKFPLFNRSRISYEYKDHCLHEETLVKEPTTPAIIYQFHWNGSYNSIVLHENHREERRKKCLKYPYSQYTGNVDLYSLFGAILKNKSILLNSWEIQHSKSITHERFGLQFICNAASDLEKINLCNFIGLRHYDYPIPYWLCPYQINFSANRIGTQYLADKYIKLIVGYYNHVKKSSPLSEKQYFTLKCLEITDLRKEICSFS